MSLVAVMGSGETAPAMVKVHRSLFAATGEGDAVLLDTPFAFQLNAEQLTAKIRSYFADSVGRTVDVARWARSDAAPVERETALARLATARWVFAGPGSPSYALRHWAGTAVPDALAEVVERGGTLVAGSAAAVTLGALAVPVYEVYKAGHDPDWIPGLDLLGRLADLPAVVLPHYDNAEGGSHDTRFCYLGEDRLRRLEDRLPDPVGVLGVDEHTALVLDLSAGTARVAGTGRVTVRRRGASTTYPGGTEVPLAELRAVLRGEGAPAASPSAPAPARWRPPAQRQPVATGPSLGSDVAAARAAFDAALGSHDVEGAVAAVLAVEEALHAWSGDTLQGREPAAARRTLRAMVVRLGELARTGARDPRTVVEPYVDLLVQLRGMARAGKDYRTSDLVRDRLAEAGVEVRDTPAGMEWHLR